MLSNQYTQEVLASKNAEHIQDDVHEPISAFYLEQREPSNTFLAIGKRKAVYEFLCTFEDNMIPLRKVFFTFGELAKRVLYDFSTKGIIYQPKKWWISRLK